MIVARIRWVAVFLLVQALAFLSPELSKGQTSSSTALTGRVSSQEEGMMEGVLVSAKGEGSSLTITVVSDSQGRYSFPRGRLEPGQYSLRIRAVGYDLDGPGRVAIPAEKTAQADLRLRRTQDLASQLTNAEWLLSAPGTRDQKTELFECVSCHTLERSFRSRYNKDELIKVVQRMGTYAAGTTPERPQITPNRPEGGRDRIPAEAIEYLSTVNLSDVPQWRFPLKTLPRPKGKATRVVITEYDLPRPHAMPHDAIVDSKGAVWYSDFGEQYLGRLDPKSGKVVEYDVPVFRSGMPTGFRVVEFDPEGTIWLSMSGQGAVGRFDPATRKFQTWNVPKGLNGASGVMPRYSNVDGKVWILAGGMVQRLDVKTGEWERETINVFRDLPKNLPVATRPQSIYDIFSDSQNNLYVSVFRSEYIGRLDAQSKKVSFYETPTFDSGPRRARFDNQDRLWFAEYRGNKIAMFDTKTERIREWEIPSPFSGPYEVVLDKGGYAWAGGMMTDRVARLHTQTGEIVEYMLPRSTNIRRVDVDNSANPPTFWAGNNHGASLIKVEPLE